jgi:hypothetical protein
MAANAASSSRSLFAFTTVISFPRETTTFLDKSSCTRSPDVATSAFASQRYKKMPGRVWGRPGIYLCNPKRAFGCAPQHQIGRAWGVMGWAADCFLNTRLLVPPAHVPRMRSAMTSQACALASSSVRSPAAEIVRAISRHFSANCRYSSTVLFCWNLGLIGITTRGWPFCSSQSRNQDTGYRRLFPP